MITHTPCLDLMEYVERNILPRYSAFDKAHDTAHANDVIRRALSLAKTTGADINMVYVVAAYHDIGMSGPRAVHHITGGRILADDTMLRKWFSPEQIKVMKEAIEDHRASASHSPRSIYGKIVAEADRDMNPEVVMRRTIQFGLSNHPSLSHEEQWARFKEHLDRKYSVDGYIRLWISGSENERNLNTLRNLMCQPQRLRQEFERIYTEETKN